MLAPFHYINPTGCMDSECQTDDWKNGRPFPHKRICGKELTEAEFEALLKWQMTPKGAQPPWSPIPAKKTSVFVPEPAPGYRRSPALLHIIKAMRDISGLDYIVRSLYTCMSDASHHIADLTAWQAREWAGTVHHRRRRGCVVSSTTFSTSEYLIIFSQTPILRESCPGYVSLFYCMHPYLNCTRPCSLQER